MLNEVYTAISHLQHSTVVDLLTKMDIPDINGDRKFDVINGAWRGILHEDGRITIDVEGIDNSTNQMFGYIIWEGKIPKDIKGCNDEYTSKISYIKNVLESNL